MLTDVDPTTHIRWEKGDVAYRRGWTEPCLVLGRDTDFTFDTCRNPALNTLAYEPDRIAVALFTGEHSGWQPRLIHYTKLLTLDEAAADFSRLATEEDERAADALARAEQHRAKIARLYRNAALLGEVSSDAD